MRLVANQQDTSSSKTVQKLFDLSFDETNTCVQCGYCLPACPTYASMGKESASPRGRINLVKLAAEGKIDIVDHLAKPIDLCLGCRACEVACPVGVPYGQILEAAKEVITEAENGQQSGNKLSRWTTATMLKKIFPYPTRLRALGNLVWLYQKAGLSKLVQKTNLLYRISKPMAQLEKILPEVESPSRRKSWGSLIPAKGKSKVRVAFFAGCLMDALMHKTNRLSIELLTLVGCEVVIPQGQNCCGALHAHQGISNQAKELAKANIEAFERTEADFYINNAGGCGAMLKEYDRLLQGEEDWAERAKLFVQKSKDISEILVQFGPLPFTKTWPGRITYQDSCHLRNVQGVFTEPRLLLQSIPGATYVELEGSDSCCASGGIYNLLHFTESMQILDEKMNQVNQTEATTVVTTNPGCLLQMSLGIEREGKTNQIKSLHLVHVLAEVCGLK